MDCSPSHAGAPSPPSWAADGRRRKVRHGIIVDGALPALERRDVDPDFSLSAAPELPPRDDEGARDGNAHDRQSLLATAAAEAPGKAAPRRKRRAAIDEGAGDAARATTEELDELAREFQDAHAQCLGAYRTSRYHAARAGNILLDAKNWIGHGEFECWIQISCGIGLRTARVYMQVARAVRDGVIDLDDPNRHSDAGLSLTAIVKSLARPRAKRPEPVDQSGAETTDGAADSTCDDGGGPRSDHRRRKDTRRGDDARPMGETAERSSQQVDAGASRGGDQETGHATQCNAEADRAWLESLPIRSQLECSVRFDKQVLLYRRIRPLLEHLGRLPGLDDEDYSNASSGSRYRRSLSSMIAVLLGIKPPDQWIICRYCKGDGMSQPQTQVCSWCRGTGVAITHVGDHVIHNQSYE